MLSYKMDFSSCDIMPGFGKSSHILCQVGSYRTVVGCQTIDTFYQRKLAICLFNKCVKITKDLCFADTLVSIKYNKTLKTLPLCLYKIYSS